MQSGLVNFKRFALMLSTVLFVFGVHGVSNGQNLTLNASPQHLSEAALDEGVVTLRLQGGTYVRFRWDIADALTVSGIRGVTIGTFGPAWFGVQRVSDTQIDVELGFDGNIDADSRLTFTVGADAITGYNGPALTTHISVTASMKADPPEDDIEETEPSEDAQDPPEDDIEETETPPTYDYLQGPYLWMIAPGSDIDADYLAVESDGAITETQVAQNGVNEGDPLGKLQWTSGRIYPSYRCGWFLCRSNNVQHVVNAAGLSSDQTLNHYTAYAFINIVSPRDQNNVQMGVGSDDAVKIWLNGTVVHRKNVNRGTSGIQDYFHVNLKAGNNLLLVKVNDDWENWGLFFRIYLDPTRFSSSIYMTGELPSVATDVNEDGHVDIHDLILVIRALGQTAPVNPRVDVNNDGRVDKTDLLIIVENLDDSTIPAAPLSRAMFATLDPALLQTWINRLRVEDSSLLSQKALAILNRLLAARQPERTVLLANYPNPFNPETWIPYQLSKPADVTLTIYSMNGQVVRQLALGHQPAGIYQTRSRAAYWDGKNAYGEPVSSGVYFYTLTAGDFTATRKMLIRK